MIPKKIEVEADVLRKHCPDAMTEEELEQFSRLTFINKDEVIKQINDLQAASFGFAWNVLKILKDRIEEL